MFLGNPGPDQWVGVTVKSTAARLQADKGLRIGIYPAQFATNESPRVDDDLNLIRLPLPYDGGFSETFNAAWAIVRAVLRNKARLPTGQNSLDLVYAADKYVAQELERRRDAPVIEICDWLRRDSQADLLAEAGVVDEPAQTAFNFASGRLTGVPAATDDTTTTLSPLPTILGD